MCVLEKRYVFGFCALPIVKAAPESVKAVVNNASEDPSFSTVYTQENLDDAMEINIFSVGNTK